MYDPTSDTWVRKADLPAPRSHSEPGTFVHDGQIFVVGGKSVTADGIDDIIKYDPLKDTWSLVGRLPQPLFAPSAKVVGDLLIVANGGAPTIENTIHTVYTTKIQSIGTHHASLKIDAGDNPDLSSTFTAGSFVLRNESTNQSRISEITVDISTAMLPDLVFDTDGTAGDLGFKGLTVDDGGSETEFIDFQYLQPHDHGSGQTNGFDILKLNFTGFDPGEEFGFSIDIDPTSMKGASGGGPAEAGKISGLELIGSTVELKFSDNQIISNNVYKLPASEVAGFCDFHLRLPDAPTISFTSQTSDHPSFYEDRQTISLTGTPGRKFNLFVSEAGWFVQGLDLDYGGTFGGFDPDLFETNKLLNSLIYTGNFGNNGVANLEISLERSDVEAGFHHFAAVEESENGLKGRISNYLLLRYLEDTRQFYFLSPGNQISLEKENVEIPILYKSVDNLDITMTAHGLPPGLQISNEGLISGSVNFGSSRAQPYSAEIIGVDGQGNTDTLLFDWIVNQDEGNWLSIGEKLAPRSENGYVAVDSFFYLIGGLPNGPSVQFNPKSGYWAEKASPPLTLHHIQPVSIAEKIYIVSGWTGSYDDPDPLTNVYIYDTGLDTWSVGPEIPDERQRASAGVVSANGSIYLLGGTLLTSGQNRLVLDQFDRYDPISNTWITLQNLPEKRSDFQAIVDGDRIYVVGGRESVGENFQDALTPEVHAYDISGSIWLNNFSTIPTPRSSCMTAVVENMLYVAGGDTGNPNSESTTEALDLSTLEWKQVAEMYVGVHGSKAVIYENRIYVSAGSSKTGFSPEPLTQQVYTPSFVNRIPPKLIEQPADQFVKVNQSFNFSLPTTIFVSRNPERENLHISSSLWNGNTLPEWLTFDPLSFSYEGIPEQMGPGFTLLKSYS